MYKYILDIISNDVNYQCLRDNSKAAADECIQDFIIKNQNLLKN